MTKDQKKKQIKKASAEQTTNNIKSETVIKQIEIKTLTETEENTESVIESKKQSEEKYSIYEYLKKNTAVLIAVVSALIAVISTILKFGSYLYHIAYLNYWNIDPKLVSTPETYWLEDIALSFALLVFGIIYMGLINETMSTFRKQKYLIKIVKTILKDNEYKFNKSKEVTKKRSTKQNKKKESDDDYDMKLDLETYKELKKWCKQASITAWGQVVVYFILFEIILGMVMYIAYLKQENINEKSSMFFFSVILILGIFIAITGYFFANINKEKLKEDLIKQSEKSRDGNIELPMFPIRKLGKLGVRFYLSNKYIFRGCIFMIVIIFAFLFMEHEQGVQDAENLKKRISITKIDNNYYSVIIQDNDNFIGERIEVNNKYAIIYLNEQIIIPKDNTEIIVKSFDDISKQYS